MSVTAEGKLVLCNKNENVGWEYCEHVCLWPYCNKIKQASKKIIIVIIILVNKRNQKNYIIEVVHSERRRDTAQETPSNRLSHYGIAADLSMRGATSATSQGQSFHSLRGG